MASRVAFDGAAELRLEELRRKQYERRLYAQEHQGTHRLMRLLGVLSLLAAGVMVWLVPFEWAAGNGTAARVALVMLAVLLVAALVCFGITRFRFR